MPTQEYIIANCPPVAQFPRYRLCRSGCVYHFRAGKWVPMSEYDDGDGYRRVKLRRDGKRYTRFVHALVLMTFVGPCPPGLICRHLDGNRANNRVENLRWGTHQENADDAKRHGTTTRGSRAHAAKLTEPEVAELLWFVENAGLTTKAVCSIWEISKAQAGQIISRNAWKHVEASDHAPRRHVTKAERDGIHNLR